jgi:hypothetical protein
MIFWLDSSSEKPRVKPWVAIITGLDAKFGLDRTFCPPVDKRKGQRAYLLEEGPLYQVQPIEGDRDFMVVREDDVEILTTEDAMELIQKMEAKKRESGKEVDGVIARFNAEGGFSTN